MPLPSFRRSREGGFSLLETIAAILLLALAFGAVMHVAGAAMKLTSHARELSRVGMWADSTLEAAGKMTPLSAGRQEGWYDARHHWQLSVTEVPPREPRHADLHVYRLDLDVAWRDERDERHEHFSTLRLQDQPAAGVP